MPTSSLTPVKSNGSPSTLNVLCLGWYDKKNCGDEAYKLSFPRLFPSVNIRFTDALDSNCDCIIIGGGDILTKRFLSQLANVKKPIFAISVTASERIADYGISFKRVLVRDFASLRNLEKEHILAEYCPDAAFNLTADKDQGRVLLNKYLKGCDPYDKVVGVVINANLMADPVRSKSSIDRLSFLKFAYDLCQVMDHTAANFVFIPFGLNQPWDDRAANGFVASHAKFWQKNTVIYDSLSVQDTINLIGTCDAMISTRLHSSIFSCAAEIPFIDITHNHKNEWFLETINHQDYSLPLRNFNFRESHLLLNEILHNPISHLLQVRMINTEQKQLLQRQVEKCTCAMMTSVS